MSSISVALRGFREISQQGRRSLSSRPLAVIVAVVALLATQAGLVAGAPAAAADTAPAGGLPTTVSADPLPTTQIDGVAWTQTILGNTVYVGGQFTNARPAGAAPGTNQTPRTNLLAYTLSTGALVTSWSPGTNGVVFGMSTSPDGKRLYVGGQFTTIAGQTRNRVAAFDTGTGSLIGSWAPDVNGKVNSVVATNTTVYLGGEFSSVNGAARTRVAAVSAADGSTLPFNATLSGGYGVRSVVISPDGSKVVIGGSFTSTNGSTNPGRGMAALDATTGASLPWAINSVIRNAGTNAAMYSLASDGDSVYGTGYDYYGTAEDGFEGSFRANWTDGSMVWMEDCHGDSYSVAASSDAVYVAGHAHYCGNIQAFPQTTPNWNFHHSLAFSKAPSGNTITTDPMGYKNYAGQPDPTLLHWFPNWVEGTFTGQSQATWDVKATDSYVVYGGEFPAVSGAQQQGLVRFAKPTAAPNKMGPQTQGGSWALNARSVTPGQARLSWTANTDPDNTRLHYQVFRSDNTSTPRWEGDQNSSFWVTPQMTWTDTSATPGQTYNYRVKVIDPFGNWTWTDWTPVTIATTAGSTYATAVLADNPASYWRLDEPSGSGVGDTAGTNPATMYGTYTRNVAGGILGDPDTATAVNGTSGAAISSQNQPGPNVFSVEAWFKTSSTAGGKVVGFGDSSTGKSSNYDRHIYLDASGYAYFGVYNFGTYTIKSPAPLNDNQWHQVVGTLDGTGMTFYVDGKRVGRNASTTVGQTYMGYWHIGGDTSWAGSPYLNGTVDDVSVYQGALTFGQVSNHYASSGRTVTKPTDAYGAAVFASGPDLYWRLGETSGPTAADSSGNNARGTYSGGVTYGVPGAVTGTTNTAVTLDGTTGQVAAATTTANPRSYSEEAWFSTTTTTGGRLFGFGNAATGLSTQADRQVVMLNTGQLRFAAGTSGVVTSAKSYNDGKWHQVVATQGAGGMTLYVDGSAVGTSTQTTPLSYTGYWRLGGDKTGDPGSTSSYFAGSVDEFAAYSLVLAPADVQAHFKAGGGVVVQPPTASFTATVTNLSVAFDGSGSTTPNGSITSYAWDFGDGQTGTGVKPSHTYAAAQAYTVKLTVTDSVGATNTATKSVTTTNAAPTASFTATVTNLSVAFDGSGSTTPNGSITSYAWDFGDGQTGTGVKPSHLYAAAQAYTVKLTVTDSVGATNTATKSVTTTAASNTIASDNFKDRTLTGSWGSAQVGGAWTLEYGAAAFSVANGKGLIFLNTNDTRVGLLSTAVSTSSDVTATFSVDRTGAGFYTQVIGRDVNGSDYSARALFEDGGTIRLYILHDETPLADSFVLPGVVYTAGTTVNLRVLVTGTNPTTVSAMAWVGAAPKPAAWQLTATDSAAAMQVAGGVGIVGRLAGWATPATATISVDSFVATKPAG